MNLPVRASYVVRLHSQNNATKSNNHSHHQKHSNVSKACIRTLFETIWNCREHFENNVFKACALNVFGTIWNCREIIENNVSKACILAVFETIWNCRVFMLKEMSLKHAFWWYLKQFGTAEK